MQNPICYIFYLQLKFKFKRNNFFKHLIEKIRFCKMEKFEFKMLCGQQVFRNSLDSQLQLALQRHPVDDHVSALVRNKHFRLEEHNHRKHLIQEILCGAMCRPVLVERVHNDQDLVRKVKELCKYENIRMLVTAISLKKEQKNTYGDQDLDWLRVKLILISNYLH